MRQTLRHHAAKIRPGLRVLFASVVVLSFFSCVTIADNNTPARRETAKTQFDRAERDRQALETRPENERSLKEYSSLIGEYKRVYLITPHAAETPGALNLVAELYRTMGDLFDIKYYQVSIDSYQFLLREYPATHFRESGLLAIAHIEQDDLHREVLAQKSYEQFLASHPQSPHAAEVRAILDKLNASSAQARQTPQSAMAPASLTAKDPSVRISLKSIAAEKTQPTTDTEQGSATDERGDSQGAAGIAHPHMECGYVYAHRDRCRLRGKISGGAHFLPGPHLLRYRRGEAQFRAPA